MDLVEPVQQADSAEAEMLRAAGQGDVERVRQLRQTLAAPLSDSAVRTVGGLLMKRRRWREAAEMLDGLPADDAAGQIQRRLARNMAALQDHRPEVYRALVTAPASNAYDLVPSRTGLPTVAYRDPSGRLVRLSANDDPQRAAHEVMRQLPAPSGQDASAVALCGLGDGYLLAHLAQHRPTLFMDRQQVVYVFEPQPAAVIPCLMIHDYTGPDGPIEQPRIQWFVGPLWMRQLERRALEDPLLPLPTTNVSQGPGAVGIAAQVQPITQRVLDRQTRDEQQIAEYYASLSGDELKSVFGPNPPRKPRSLLVTTRFSTVLQYSTRDTAEAFEQLGCEARVLIEPSPYHRLLRPALSHMLAEYRPDMVFQLDHLRQEYTGLFPPNLPFVCWIQDHLSNLTSPTAGRNIGLRDYVLTDTKAHYVSKWGYPAANLMDLNKLTRVDPLPRQQWAQDGDDISFVSNASHDPRPLLEAYVAKLAAPDAVKALVEACGQRILGIYERGECLPTYMCVRELFEQAQREMAVPLGEQEIVRLSAWLMHPFNDALYRQQALGWVADVAGELGLSFGLYGNGWDRHPTLHRHARGPVAYGDALAQLTRRTRLNLQVVPYLCLHQRLLDGLAAGGFFLIRQNPTETTSSQLAAFLDKHVGCEVSSLDEVRQAVSAEHRAELERLLEACRPCVVANWNEDPVPTVRGWQRCGLLVAGDGVLPHFDEVSFADREGLRARIARFLADPSLRDRISQAQRRSVLDRFSYEAGLRKVISFVGQRLAWESASGTDVAGGSRGSARP